MQRSIRRFAAPAVAWATFAAGWLGYVAIAEAAEPVSITLNGTSATSSSSTGVSISGSVVTITAAGSYQFAGALNNGQVVVNTTDTGTVGLILNGVSIANSTTSPLNVADAGSVTVTLAAGTTNTLSDASTYVYPDPAVTEPNAALFSTADLTITGTGALNVRGNAYDGIASKDGLVIESGTITVNAADDGIRGKDYLKINNGAITVTSGGDGVKSTNDSDAALGYLSMTAGSLAVTAGTDCVQAVTSVTVSGGSQTLACGDDAVHADAALTISSGTMNITRSVEGLESKVLTISGGNTTINSSDDGVNGTDGVTNPNTNAAGVLVTISGGTTVVNANGDGIDSNGALRITGGTAVVNGPTANNNGALDANGTFTDTGGTLLAVGSAGMAVAPASSGSQGFVNVRFSSVQASGVIVHLVSSTGTELAAFRSSKQFQSVVFASGQLVPGQSYLVYTGGSVSGTSTGGLYTSGSISGATQVTTVTASGSQTGGSNPTVAPTTTPTTNPTTSPTVNPTNAPGRACTATYVIIGQWTDGFQGEVTVTAGSSAIAGWAVTWTFADGQAISQSWGATVTTSGSAVTATNVAYNGALAASAPTTFGFIGSWTGTNSVPAVTCTAS